MLVRPPTMSLMHRKSQRWFHCPEEVRPVFLHPSGETKAVRTSPRSRHLPLSDEAAAIKQNRSHCTAFCLIARGGAVAAKAPRRRRRGRGAYPASLPLSAFEAQRGALIRHQWYITAILLHFAYWGLLRNPLPFVCASGTSNLWHKIPYGIESPWFPTTKKPVTGLSLKKNLSHNVGACLTQTQQSQGTLAIL